MIVNDNLVKEYGQFNITLSKNTILPFKPAPSPSDYARGYFDRHIMVKTSDKTAIEISSEDIGNVDEQNYGVYSVSWRISGKKDFTKIDNIIEDYGVKNQNLQQIEKVKSNSRVDLTSVLKNPLEFWRGY